MNRLGDRRLVKEWSVVLHPIIAEPKHIIQPDWEFRIWFEWLKALDNRKHYKLEVEDA